MMSPNVPTLEAARAYLRHRDKIGGYLPLLAMRPDSGEQWTRLWTAIRQLDDRSEEGAWTAASLLAVDHHLLNPHPSLAEALRDLAQWPRVEAALYQGAHIQTIQNYFQLMYYRAFLPVYICGIVGLPGEQQSALETFAMYVGYGAQLMDDTLDLCHDLAHGRVFVTQEELDHLGIAVNDLTTPQGLHCLRQFRNKWALYYYLHGYRATSLFAPANRRLARSWLEFGLRALLDGRISPLPLEIVQDHQRYCNHFGVYMALFDLPWLSEAWRYRLLYPVVQRLIQAASIVDIRAVRAYYERSATPLPEEFQVEQLYGRCWRPLKLPPDVLEERRPVSLVHYGIGGILPTAWALGRLVFFRSSSRS